MLNVWTNGWSFFKTTDSTLSTRADRKKRHVTLILILKINAYQRLLRTLEEFYSEKMLALESAYFGYFYSTILFPKLGAKTAEFSYFFHLNFFLFSCKSHRPFNIDINYANRNHISNLVMLVIRTLILHRSLFFCIDINSPILLPWHGNYLRSRRCLMQKRSFIGNQ